VGIGLSAGGLEAVSALLEALPPAPGAAFVVVQHLDPNHESQLAHLLSRVTPMPVHEVTDGMRVAADHVYVIPPRQIMQIEEGRLHLAPAVDSGIRTTVDHFFTSLARDAGGAAMGVVLSGTASDGTRGLAAIKAEAGFTFAQDEASSRYFGMPGSAIASGCVDYVLPPAAIATEIARLAAHPYLEVPAAVARQGSEPPEDPDGGYLRIVQILRAATRIDFALYKQTTLRRRIARRMAMNGAATPADYVKRLEEDPDEVARLHSDVLINVTAFFRDPAAFEALGQCVAAALPADGRKGPLRVWVPGCSSGEEAYSLLIVLLECLGDASGTPIQLFATDVSESMVARAREGIYPPAALEGVAGERLARFFTKTDGGYRVSKALRQMCVFSRQNVAHDPPFSRLDLVSCRNLLIYLGASLQRKVLSVFHYALNPGGILFLGSNETTTPAADLFEAADRKHRIFTKKPLSGRPQPLAAGPAAAPGPLPLTTPVDVHLRSPSDVAVEASRVAMERYVPPGVVVDARYQIQTFRGDTQPYLEHSPGQASLNLLTMARPRLDMELRKLLVKASRTRTAVRQEGIAVRSGGRIRRVDVAVVPLEPKGANERYFQVFFEPVLEPSRRAAKPPAPGRRDDRDRRIAELERELASARELTQAVVQEHEAVSEELRAAHEEALSANEELQSTNEELNTASEEIQSTNEELTTLNEEMETQNRALSELNDDHANLLASTRLPILFLSRDLRIRKFTPPARQVLNMIPSDVGRPVTDLRGPVDIPALRDSILEVIQTLRECRREVQDEAGRWFDLRVLPYRTGDDRIDGAVLVLTDIDAFKRSEAEIHRARLYAEAIVETIGEGLLVLDERLVIRSANRAFYEMFRTTASATIGRPFDAQGSDVWRVPRLAGVLKEALASEGPVQAIELSGDLTGAGERTLIVSIRRVQQLSQGDLLVLVAIRDVTERLRAQQEIERHSEELARLNRDLSVFGTLLSHDLLEPLRMVTSYVRLVGERYAEALGEEGRKFMAHAEGGARTMEEMVHGLLRLSQIEAKATAVRPVDAGQALAAALRNLRVAVEEAQALVQSDSLPVVVADEPQLVEVFQNLLANAIRYRGAEPPRVHVEARRDQAMWRIGVHDNGIGVAPELRERVFEMFYRGRKDGRGAGVGLSVVRRIVERQGGRVWLESEPGQGSTVYFTLPAPPGAGHEPVARPQ